MSLNTNSLKLIFDFFLFTSYEYEMQSNIKHQKHEFIKDKIMFIFLFI